MDKSKTPSGTQVFAGGAPFCLVGYFSCLYDIPWGRYLLYREKGMWCTGGEVFGEVPLPPSWVVFVFYTMYQRKEYFAGVPHPSSWILLAFIRCTGEKVFGVPVKN